MNTRNDVLNANSSVITEIESTAVVDTEVKILRLLDHSDRVHINQLYIKVFYKKANNDSLFYNSSFFFRIFQKDI